MTQILRIDSSSRPAGDPASGIGGSYSRWLADLVAAEISHAEPSARFIHRDLAISPVPHIANETIQGYYTPASEMTEALQKATALSDELIREIEIADTLLLSIPIYNFSLPSALKAWIDQVVRIGRTFSYEQGNFTGLLQGKNAYVCYAYGAAGYDKQGPLASYDAMSPYVKLILNFIGVTDVTEFSIEATTADLAIVNQQREAARQSIERHFTRTPFSQSDSHPEGVLK